MQRTCWVAETQRGSDSWGHGAGEGHAMSSYPFSSWVWDPVLLSGGWEDGRRRPPSPWWNPGSSPAFVLSILNSSLSISLLEALRPHSSSITAIPPSEWSSTGLGPRIQSVRGKGEKTWGWNTKHAFLWCSWCVFEVWLYNQIKVWMYLLLLLLGNLIVFVFSRLPSFVEVQHWVHLNDSLSHSLTFSLIVQQEYCWSSTNQPQDKCEGDLKKGKQFRGE